MCFLASEERLARFKDSRDKKGRSDVHALEADLWNVWLTPTTIFICTLPLHMNSCLKSQIDSPGINSELPETTYWPLLVVLRSIYLHSPTYQVPHSRALTSDTPFKITDMAISLLEISLRPRFTEISHWAPESFFLLLSDSETLLQFWVLKIIV